MTDKEKVRKEIQRLQDLTMDENKNFYSEAAEGEYNALCNIEHFIDSLQEEPDPQFKVGDIIRSKVWEKAVHKIVSIDNSAYYFKNGGMVRFDDQEQWELVEEPVSEDLEKVAYDFVMDNLGNPKEPLYKFDQRCFRAGAKWQKEHLWKPADGDDLPVIDKEVIVLLNSGKVVFAHRPYKGKYIGKSLTTGNIETFENKTYDKGGWSIPDVKFWLDCEWPNKEE